MGKLLHYFNLKNIYFETLGPWIGSPYVYAMVKHRAILSLVQELPASSLMELGCANGLMGLSIAHRKGISRVVGIDINERAIQHARHLSGKFPEIDCTFSCCNIDDFVTKETFDLVLMIDVLQYSKSAVQMLKRVRNCVSPSGYLLLYVPVEPPPVYFFKYRILKNRHPDWSNLTKYTRDSIRHHVLGAGYRVISVREILKGLSAMAHEWHWILRSIHYSLPIAIAPLLLLPGIFDPFYTGSGLGVTLLLQKEA